jgi:phosphate transport system ATP-binding protein
MTNMEETKPTHLRTGSERTRAGAPSAVPSTDGGVSEGTRTIIDVRDVDFHYGLSQALFGINLKVSEKRVTAFIGPSGCGKSTLLRCCNRMNDLVDRARVTAGSIKIENVDINSPQVDVIELRRRVGMVFQKSNPFPKSIAENIAYGLRVGGVNDRAVIAETVESSSPLGRSKRPPE